MKFVNLWISQNTVKQFKSYAKSKICFIASQSFFFVSFIEKISRMSEVT